MFLKVFQTVLQSIEILYYIWSKCCVNVKTKSIFANIFLLRAWCVFFGKVLLRCVKFHRGTLRWSCHMCWKVLFNELQNSSKPLKCKVNKKITFLITIPHWWIDIWNDPKLLFLTQKIFFLCHSFTVVYRLYRHTRITHTSLCCGVYFVDSKQKKAETFKKCE